MDAVLLPLVMSDLKIVDAVKLLKERRRSGLVVEKGKEGKEHYWLHYIGSLLKARDQGEPATVGQLEGGHELLIPDQTTTSRFGLDLIRPLRTDKAYEAALDEGGREYALIGEVEDTVTVVTRREGLRDMLVDTTGGYRCTGTPTHYFPEPRVSVNDRCPQRGECGAGSVIVPD